MDDESLMPFGKYAGQKLANIPAEYLIWLYENGKIYGSIKDYIRENMDVLKEEVKRKQNEKKKLFDDIGVGDFNGGEFYK